MTSPDLLPRNDFSRFLQRITIPTLLLVTVAILLAPTPTGMQAEGKRLIAVTFLMAGLWLTQAIPLAATGLLPLMLFPLLAIQDSRTVSSLYINEQVFLYLGGFIIALGIERWKLHSRIALNVVRIVGVSPKRLVLGFLIATGGLSMWISNTASTLLMLPIALALLKTLDETSNGNIDGTTNESSTRVSDVLAVPLLLAIAYSASIGGMTTIVGTPTNNQAVGIYHDTFPELPRLSVANWLMACLPIGIVYGAVAWFVLTRGLPAASDTDQSMRQVLRSRLEHLGKPTAAELRMLTVFLVTALLWVFRKPLISGVAALWPWLQSRGLPLSVTGEEFRIQAGALVSDSTVSMTMAILLFFLPSGTNDETGRAVPLMDWPTASKLPWDIVLLFGGGFALAGAFKSTGLALWLGDALQGPLQGQPMWLVIAVVCLLMTFLTEFTSNVATISTLMPTLAAICVSLEVDPRLLIVPATLATSCAFMLPIATPPNAIIFGSGRIEVRQMARYGILLNLVGVLILTAGTFLLIKPLMGIE